jgi:cytochrome o ubiquinol oxidase subunit II
MVLRTMIINGEPRNFKRESSTVMKLRRILLSIVSLALVLGLSGCKYVMLDPKGPIAASEKTVLLDAIGLMLIVVIPVIILSLFFAWRYHKKRQAKYRPDWAHSVTLELIWWAIPCVIIVILAIMTWVTTHKLDPYKPIKIKGKTPVTIQVVAMNWKWLFIYPKQHIAVVNFAEIPVGTPINLQITADAPMNSLQIPQLAGQIYAMSGMRTKLHIVADEPGNYRGFSANYSGDGFSGMHFIMKATNEQDFNAWVKQAQHASQTLDYAAYDQLAKKSENNPVVIYKGVPSDLFMKIMMKYMMPNMEHLAKS